MQKRAPTFGQVATIGIFVLSCFGLLLFLWVTFGGPTPLAAKSYEIDVPFQEATQLADQSDVRISGVSVGKVNHFELASTGDAAVATLEIDPKYAPLPKDTTAILRQKTLLGETYVELTPGSPHSGALPDGGSLPAGQVSDAVQLDEVFRTFDPETRVAFQQWMQDSAIAFKGRGYDFSQVIAQLEPTFTDADKLLRILDTQRLAVRALVRNGGEVFQTLGERRGELSGLIKNAERVFATTARRNADLKNTFVVLPTFLRESRSTLARLETFSRSADPLVRQLRPSARELAPTLIDLGRLAPQLRQFFVGLNPVITKSPAGLGALRRTLRVDLPPLFGKIPQFSSDLIPILNAVGDYKHEITGLLGNASSATNALGSTTESNGKQVHYLRTISPVGPSRWRRSPSA